MSNAIKILRWFTVVVVLMMCFCIYLDITIPRYGKLFLDIPLLLWNARNAYRAFHPKMDMDLLSIAEEPDTYGKENILTDSSSFLNN